MKDEERRTKPARTVQVTLDEKDLRIVVQSLTHCLATCASKAQKPDEPCEDCDAAAKLRDRLAKAPKQWRSR